MTNAARHASTASKRSTADGQSNGGSEGPAQSGDRILVVDDEEAVRGLLGRVLERSGYRWEGVPDAASARQCLAAEEFALILCDVQMPGESGLDLVRDVLHNDPSTAAIMVTGLDDPKLAAEALEIGAYGWIVKPFRRNDVVITVINALRRRQLELESRTQHERLEEMVKQRTKELRVAIAQLERSARELSRSREEEIRRLSRAVERRDPETGGHVERMSHYCALLGRRLGIDPDAIRVASTMHDVGKIGVPDSVLLKPEGLTPEEWTEMERHPILGHELLTGSDSELLEMAATIALTHHEKFDGSGYPRRLAGDEIPLEGRVAAVADVFDALTSDRVYRPAFSTEKAVDIMRCGRGSHFDPVVLDIFLDSMDEVLEIRERFADDAAEGSASRQSPAAA